MNWWWMSDRYEETQMPAEFRMLAGPEGIAAVQVWQDGSTQRGWGGDTFMKKYERQRFADNIRETSPYALVMRSLRMLCIDIDGKNGGEQHVGKLGMLPYTAAETSKSGNGYHLFYAVPDEWDENEGFALIRDRIGIVQGVDIRGTGCVFHFPSQRWNGRSVADAPEFLLQKLKAKDAAVAAQIDGIVKILDSAEEEEVLLMQDQLVQDLNKPIPAGRRNSTLFAIGSQLMIGQVPDWETLVMNRALVLGLDQTEARKIVANIEKYGAKA